VPLVGAGRRVEDDHAVVHVAVGDVELVGRFVDGHAGGAAEVLGVVAAAALALVADLQQKPTVARELQDLRVLLAAAAEPHVILRIHVDAVFELRPLVAGAGSAPRLHQRTVLIEFEHRRRRLPDRSRLVRLQRRRTVRDPDVIAPVHGDARHGAHQPVVRQRLRPRGIDSIGGRAFQASLVARLKASRAMCSRSENRDRRDEQRGHGASHSVTLARPEWTM
jgi:hypothetical protein